ncbi:MAG: hypothetical protein ACQESR_28550 [Planctomycetota bacterium]
MESCPTQAVLPLLGLAAEQVIRDRYNNRSQNVVPASRKPVALGSLNGFVVAF